MTRSRTTRAPAPSTTAALALVLTLAGCSLFKVGDGDAPLITTLGAAEGEDAGTLVTPHRNALKVMIAARPVDEPSLGQDLWSVADEHVVDSDVRTALEANGLRIGLIDGALPPEVEEILDPEAPPDLRIDPAVFSLPDGQSAPIMLGPPTPAERLTLFLRRDSGAVGRDYEKATGAVRVTADQRDDGAIALRFVPEVHSGDDQIRYEPIANTGPLEPLQFGVKNGQQEESFRDLTARLTVRPGQVVILGCWPDRTGSLGHFLLTQEEPKSDRLVQRVVFLWAVPTTATEIPWVAPVAPPGNLQPVDPDAIGLRAGPAKE